MRSHLTFTVFHCSSSIQSGGVSSLLSLQLATAFRPYRAIRFTSLKATQSALVFAPRFLMTEQTPEVVAAADVSPCSPKPIHTSATSPALVPSLQDHAATLDVAYLDSLTTAPFPFVAMPATPAADPAANAGDASNAVPSLRDTIVVRGDETPNGSQDEDEGVDEESLDAYGEEDDELQGDAVSGGPASSQVQHAAESGTGNGTEAETTTAQPDVSEASSESILSSPSTSPSSDPNVQMKSESPAATALASRPDEPQSAIAPTDGIADSPDANTRPEVDSETVAEYTAAASEAAAAAAADGEREDSGAVDIQKLVDDITAKAVASSPSATTASQVPAEASVAPVEPIAPSISLPQSSSLPPKPVLSQQAGRTGSRPEDFHPFQSRAPNNPHGLPPMPMQGVVHSQPGLHGNAPYMAGVAAPGTVSDAGSSSLPPPPSMSFNGSAQPHGSLPTLPTVPASGSSQSQGPYGAQPKEAWEAFQADEKRYMTEAKWERFPDNSRIFIGES